MSETYKGKNKLTRTDPTEGGADPGLIYVNKEDDKCYGGYVYAYTTAIHYEPSKLDDSLSKFSMLGIKVYRTKDMFSWEPCGIYKGFCFPLTNEQEMWCNGLCWAPEVIYVKEINKYLMYFCMRSYEGDDKTTSYMSSKGTYDRMYLALAASSTPVGPFELLDSNSYYEMFAQKDAHGEFIKQDGYLLDKSGNKLTKICGNKILNLNDEFITTRDPFINLNSKEARKYISNLPENGFISCIDPSIFIDDDGEIYVYFVNGVNTYKATLGDRMNFNEIWGLRMKDFFTPDYSTLSLVTFPNYKSCESPSKIVDGIRKVNVDPREYILKDYFDEINKEQYAWSTVNEGPQMLKHNGLYYLTFAPCGTGNKYYSIAQAISNNPLKGFRKLTEYSPIIGVSDTNDNMWCTGHHSFVTLGNELWTCYHAKKPGDNDRLIASSRCFFTRFNNLDYDVLVGNGPSLFDTPVPEQLSGYKNIADEMILTCKNCDKETLKYLTDGIYTSQPFSKEKEFIASQSIHLKGIFKKNKYVKSIFVYNSIDYKSAFKSIDSCIVRDTNGHQKEFKNIAFPIECVNIKEKYLRTGGNIELQIDMENVQEIELKISSKFDDSNNQIKISDIQIIGR